MTISKYRTQPSFISPFNDLMNGSFTRDIGQLMGHDDVQRSLPSVNIVERAQEFEISMLAPGFGRKDIKLSVENDVLTISAGKKTEELKENERFTRREFSYGTFSRNFRLPDTVNSDGITASLTEGVLRVSIPKAEEVKPRTREIGIQ